MKRLLLLFSFISITGIAGAQSLWKKEHRKVFMETCMDGLKDVTTKKISKKYCACYMQRLEQVYPDPIDADKLTQEQINEFAEYCMKASGLKEAKEEEIEMK